VVADVQVHDDDGLHGAALTEPYTLGAGTLTDTAGEDFDVRKELEAPLTLVFFGYSKCPDICQTVMADLASAVARLDDGQADQVATWFVTTDPARDDPATLRAYLDRFDPSFEGLTAPLPEVVGLATSVHVPIEKGPRLPSGGYEVTHGTPVLGVTPDGSVPVLWTEGTSAAKLAEDIDTILTEGIPSTDGAG
jgi:protein SCO1/2